MKLRVPSVIVLGAMVLLSGCRDETVSSPDPLASEQVLQAVGGPNGAEIWLVDQSSSLGLTYGGEIHIFKALSVIPISKLDADRIERADPHGIRVRTP